MIADIVIALVIFYVGIPLAFAGVLWVITLLFEKPIQTILTLLILGGIIASMASK